MGLKASAKVDGETLQVDPQLLFQRLIIATNGLELGLPSTFDELSCPSALIDPSGWLRVADKAKLTDALESAAIRETEMWEWQLSSGRLDPCATDPHPPPALELLLKMF